MTTKSPILPERLHTMPKPPINDGHIWPLVKYAPVLAPVCASLVTAFQKSSLDKSE